MHLERRHTNDRAILFMPLVDLEAELAFLDNVEIRFSPLGKSRKLWSRKLGKWVKVQPIYCETGKIRPE